MSAIERDEVGDTSTTEAEARIAADLSFDPECPFREHPGHECLRRDGRSVGVLGENGDCHQGAQFLAYNGELDDSKRRHPSAYEPDVAYLLQQSLIDQDDAKPARPLRAIDIEIQRALDPVRGAKGWRI